MGVACETHRGIDVRHNREVIAFASRCPRRLRLTHVPHAAEQWLNRAPDLQHV